MGKGFIFFAFIWMIVTIAGGVMQGSLSIASTVLTADINATTETIPVADTDNFPDTGTIVIGDERIAYPDKTATSFLDTLAQPTVRGADNTDAASHSAGDRVRTVEGGMMNTVASYHIAVIADASGLWAAVTIALSVLRIIGSYLILPTSFLGTDLMIIGALWWVGMAGMLVSLGISLAGGRRV